MNIEYFVCVWLHCAIEQVSTFFKYEGEIPILLHFIILTYQFSSCDIGILYQQLAYLIYRWIVAGVYSI